MNLKSLTNDSLWSKTQDLVREERKLTLQVLWHIREVDRRGLHLERSYSSLFDFVTRGLGYSPSAAMRRIESMRLLRELPEMENKIASGELNLTTVSMVQNFLKNEKKQEREYSQTEKKELLESLCGKSTRDVEKKLIELAPETAPLRRESQRVITPNLTEIKFLADAETMALMEQVKDQMGGKNAYPDFQGLFQTLARAYLAKKNPKPKETSAPKSEITPGTRTPSAAQKRALRTRAQDQCEHNDPKTGQRCPSKRNLEIDHIQSWSAGGKTELSNLQLLCWQHHRRKTLSDFGAVVEEIEPIAS